MKLKTYRVRLPLRHPFTISRGTLHYQQSLVVELSDGQHTGIGEVTENSYYGHSFESLEGSLDKIRSTLSRYEDTVPEDAWCPFFEELDRDSFAMSALDMAAHDLWGKRTGQPSWQRWGLTWENTPDSSYTIGIDSVEKMIAKLREQAGWSIYKIKLGSGEDLEVVRALRQETDATFRVDANCGWDAEQTITYSAVLRDLGVEFIEQPLPADADASSKQRVYAESSLPIIADENCQVPADVVACQRFFHGVNVKICKCGGLTPALSMLKQAHQLGMKTMVGCMVESAVGISGAAHLLPLLDYADLDGADLLRDAPAQGLQVQLGKIEMPTEPGNGAQLAESRLGEFLCD